MSHVARKRQSLKISYALVFVAGAYLAASFIINMMESRLAAEIRNDRARFQALEIELLEIQNKILEIKTLEIENKNSR